jgi:hypothetical protein
MKTIKRELLLTGLIVALIVVGVGRGQASTNPGNGYVVCVDTVPANRRMARQE